MEEIIIRKTELNKLIEAFIKENLEDKLNNNFFKVSELLFDNYSEELLKGKCEAWACGIAHNTCVKNQMDIKISNIYKFFNVSSSTGLKRSKDVEKMINNIKSSDCNNNELNFEVIKTIADENYIQAQKIIQEAYNQKNFKQRVKLANKALEICKDCSDAYIILANDKGLTDSEKENLLRKAVKASINILGVTDINRLRKEEFLKEELTPYLGAQYRLANHLWLTENRDEATEICMNLLRNNPKDRLIIRSILLSWTIITNKDNYTNEILNKYKNDYLTASYYSKALFNIKIGNIREGKIALRKAIQYNKFVIPYILKMKRIPKELPIIERFRSHEEAIHYMLYGYEAWYSVSDAINILKEIKKEFVI
ncbi:hypothetical protein I3900191A7_16840 [Clostridium baratii]|uniref:DUF6398 domain-containing protein n=1 Tax=Clostridium baratii TaxID=1561 RepID=UPI0036F40C8A